MGGGFKLRWWAQAGVGTLEPGGVVFENPPFGRKVFKPAQTLGTLEPGGLLALATLDVFSSSLLKKD